LANDLKLKKGEEGEAKVVRLGYVKLGFCNKILNYICPRSPKLQ